jgi:hypothetical protein
MFLGITLIVVGLVVLITGMLTAIFQRHNVLLGIAFVAMALAIISFGAEKLNLEKEVFLGTVLLALIIAVLSYVFSVLSENKKIRKLGGTTKDNKNGDSQI